MFHDKEVFTLEFNRHSDISYWLTVIIFSKMLSSLGHLVQALIIATHEMKDLHYIMSLHLSFQRHRGKRGQTDSLYLLANSPLCPESRVEQNELIVWADVPKWSVISSLFKPANNLGYQGQQQQANTTLTHYLLQGLYMENWLAKS